MKRIALLSLSLLALAVVSCSKDSPEGAKAPLVTGYQIVTDYGNVQSREVVTPTYDARGRVVEFDVRGYTEKNGESTLIRLDNRKITYNDAAHSAEMVYERGLVVLGQEITLLTPVKYTLTFDEDWRLIREEGGYVESSFSYDGSGRIQSRAFTVVDDELSPVQYCWSGGDLVSMSQDSYKVTYTYGTEANPFTGAVDPVLGDNSSVPDYYFFGLLGTRSAHLPVSMTDDFYGDAKFIFEYIRDSEGRIVEVGIHPDRATLTEDVRILISY